MPHAIVNLKHEPHALARGAVRIDRRTKWGNPYRIGKHGTREEEGLREGELRAKDK